MDNGRRGADQTRGVLAWSPRVISKLPRAAGPGMAGGGEEGVSAAARLQARGGITWGLWGGSSIEREGRLIALLVVLHYARYDQQGSQSTRLQTLFTGAILHVNVISLLGNILFTNFANY